MNNKEIEPIVWVIAFGIAMTSSMVIMRLSSEGLWTGIALFLLIFSMVTLSVVAHSNK